MSQITLYLDAATQALVDRAARDSGLSKSRWVAEAIRRQVAQQWPADWLGLAGRFPDFPLHLDAAAEQPADVPRIAL